MPWLDQIAAEAAKSFMQALKITGYLFWWATIGLVALVRQITQNIDASKVRGGGATASGQPIAPKPCRVCGAVNERNAQRCFACGSQL